MVYAAIYNVMVLKQFSLPQLVKQNKIENKTELYNND